MPRKKKIEIDTRLIFVPPTTASLKGVLVPEGWTRKVVMRGQAAIAAEARKTSAMASRSYSKAKDGDRDTYYTSSCGLTIKSKYEVNKFLALYPNCGVALRDFYFERSPRDLPPVRLLAPSTPPPAAFDTGSRGNGALSLVNDRQLGTLNPKP